MNIFHYILSGAYCRVSITMKRMIEIIDLKCKNINCVHILFIYIFDMGHALVVTTFSLDHLVTVHSYYSVHISIFVFISISIYCSP